MYRITDVVKHLLIINGLMFLGTAIIPVLAEYSNMLGVYFPGSPNFRPFQLVSYMFMHFGFTHLLFNMFALFMFGPPVESYLGPKRFLFYYFFTGFGALALHFVAMYLEAIYAGIPADYVATYYTNSQMRGASGAVFGLLAAFGTLFPNHTVQLLIPPIPMKAKYFVLIFAGIELFLGLGPISGTGIAHFAHLGGALFGFLLILYWRNVRSR